MPGAICGILCRMETNTIDALEINPASAPQASIIWLHGLGADGNDFAPLIPQLDIVDSLAVRVVLPHAPRRAVTINNGMLMRAWYDISATDFRAIEDGPGIRDSARLLEALVRREAEHGVPAERILLAGFSQGGAVVLHTGLRYPQRLAGILVLSAYLPLAASLPAERSPANRSCWRTDSRTPSCPCRGRRGRAITWSSRATRLTGMTTRCRTPCVRRKSGTFATGS